MTGDDYKTMRVPADKWREAKEQKEAAGRTWGEQIVRPEVDGDNDSTTEAEVVDKMRQSIETVEERTGRIERQLEELGR